MQIVSQIIVPDNQAAGTVALIGLTGCEVVSNNPDSPGLTQIVYMGNFRQSFMASYVLKRVGHG